MNVNIGDIVYVKWTSLKGEPSVVGVPANRGMCGKSVWKEFHHEMYYQMIHLFTHEFIYYLLLIK